MGQDKDDMGQGTLAEQIAGSELLAKDDGGCADSSCPSYRQLANGDTLAVGKLLTRKELDAVPGLQPGEGAVIIAGHVLPAAAAALEG